MIIENNSSGWISSILLITRKTGVFVSFKRSIINSSPRPKPSVALIINEIKSTSLSVFCATFIIKSPNLCFGLWIPGVSINTICAWSSVYTPWILFLVVCGLSLIIAIFWPITRFKKVDFPTFGLPIIETKPDLNSLLLM